MLAQKMIDQLNDQINMEFFSSNLYLQMSAWCEDKGFEGAAKFMRVHADEEMGHMHRLFTYVSETGGMPLLGTIEAPESDFPSLLALFEYTYEHEQLITKKLMNWLMQHSRIKITLLLIFYSGMCLSSMKKKNCLNQLSIKFA